MPSVATKSKTVARAKRRPKVKSMTKLEMVQKMLADQKIIREAIQNGIPLKELEKLMALSLQPYPIQKIDDRTYGFITVKGIEYRCSFLSYAGYFTNHPDIVSFFLLKEIYLVRLITK